jgi:hypothetical protein
MARSDYKVSPSGRKAHKYIVFKDKEDSERDDVKEEIELDESLDPSEIASNPKMYDSATAKKAYYHKNVTADDKKALERHLDRHHGNKEWRKPVKEGYEDHHLFPDYMQKILKKHEQSPEEKAHWAKKAAEARANAKPVNNKAEPYKPLGGRDEKSGRSYSEEVDQIDEISSKLAGDYYGAATKKHLDKVGIKPNMYDRIAKDMGKKRKAGVDRALDRITGARKTNEDLVTEGAFEKAEENKRSADAAKKYGNTFDYHLHMADHHDNMAEWHGSRGRHGEADKHAEKAEQHHELAMKHKDKVKKEEVDLEENHLMDYRRYTQAAKNAKAKGDHDIAKDAEEKAKKSADNYKRVTGKTPSFHEEKETSMLSFKDIMEKMNLSKASMGDVIKDFQKSDAPQFAGKSDEKKRQMAIAAKLEAERGVKEETEEVEEELKGNQHKIDKNKNGKVDAHDFKLLRKEEEEMEEKFDPLKHVKNPTPGEKKAAKDVKRSSYADRAAMLRSAQADGRLKEEEEIEEQAPVAPSLMKHRISVTVSDPDHTMVSKRKEKIQKTVIVTHSDNKEGAKKVGEKFYKKKGYIVHDSNHAGMVKEEVEELDELSKKTLSSYAKKAMRDAAVKHKYAGDYDNISDRSRKPDIKKAADAKALKYKEKYVRRRDGVDAAIDRLAKEEVEQIDEVNHREFAQAGKMHPTMAQYMKSGQEIDFYHSKTGDKISGKVTKNDGKNIHVQANKGGKVGGGETHKFAVSKNLGGQMREGVDMPMTYKEFMEALWPGTAEYKKKFADKERTTGAGARHDIVDTGKGVRATRRFSDNDTAEAPKTQERRGRGRPAGSKSGANQKVTTKSDESGGMATHSLRLPSR